MPRAIIEDHIKRQAVQMMQDGHGAFETAEKCGLKIETVYGNWKRWAKDIEDELPDIVKPFVKPPVIEPVVLKAEEVPEETPDENTPRGEVPGTEVTEVPKEEGKMEKKDALERAVGLIRELDRLLTEYLQGEHAERVKVAVDSENMVELNAGVRSAGKITALLTMQITVKEGET